MAKVLTATQTKARPMELPKVISKDDDVNPASLSTTSGPEARRWFEAMLRKARREGAFMTEEILTASLARLLLEVNPDNRPVGRAKVEELAASMKNGAFDGMNGQTIQISEDGLLNDGQHRLHAKLMAQVDFKTRFMFGLPRDARMTIDQGKQRTAGDYLTMDGYKDGAAAAAVGVMLAQWQHEGTLRRTGGGTAWRLARSEVADFTRQNYELIATSLAAIKRRPGMAYFGGIGLLGFTHVLLAEKHFQGATDFIDRLVGGFELSEDSPITVVRRRLMTEKRLDREEKFELILRAWNAWRRGDKPKQLPINKRIPVIEN